MTKASTPGATRAQDPAGTSPRAASSRACSAPRWRRSLRLGAAPGRAGSRNVGSSAEGGACASRPRFLTSFPSPLCEGFLPPLLSPLDRRLFQQRNLLKIRRLGNYNAWKGPAEERDDPGATAPPEEIQSAVRAGRGGGRTAMKRHPLSDRLRGITQEIVATYGASRDPAYHIDPERRLPSRRVVVRILENLAAVLYPGFHGVQHLTRENVEYHVGALLDDIAADLYEQIVLAYEFERTAGLGGEEGIARLAENAV